MIPDVCGLTNKMKFYSVVREITDEHTVPSAAEEYSINTYNYVIQSSTCCL